LHALETAIGDRPAAAGGHVGTVTSSPVRLRLFLIALERGFLDTLLDRIVTEPFTRVARLLTRLDQWLCDAALPARRPAAAEGGDQDE
jgi:hypothetical protein